MASNEEVRCLLPITQQRSNVFNTHSDDNIKYIYQNTFNLKIKWIPLYILNLTTNYFIYNSFHKKLIYLTTITLLSPL